MSPKEKVYYLIKEYKKGNYSTNIFCDEITNVYNLELDHESLNEVEKKYLKELISVTSRFSPYIEDLKIPNVFFNENQVKEKLDEVIRKLYIEL
jgi:hypothetical protein